MPRLKRARRNGLTDYKIASRWLEIIQDESFFGSSELLKNLSQTDQILWLTSRNIKSFPATLYWLWINHFPISALVCTGSMARKIEFIKIFSRNHDIHYIIDDMQEGYEFGSPVYVQEYKDFLEKKGYVVFENLQSVKEHLGAELRDFDKN